MGMQQEMMNDQMDDAMDDGETETNADEVYNQILGEVGMQMNNDIKAGDGAIANPGIA
jgi:charged multivesicular body protein 2A